MTISLSADTSRTPRGGVRSRLASGLRRWRDRVSERKQMMRLLDCDDHVLNDIGVSRPEVRLRLERYFG